MNKFLITVVLVAGGIASATAQYESMELTTLEGKTDYISLSDLSITFDEGNLIARAGSGATVTIPLVEMDYMQFSSEEAGITTIVSEISRSNPTEIFEISGVSRGTFSSLLEAKEALPAGVYLLRTANGQTSKLYLK